eukprot:6288151-Pyramimonas_sp.AAC.1
MSWWTYRGPGRPGGLSPERTCGGACLLRAAVALRWSGPWATSLGHPDRPWCDSLRHPSPLFLLTPKIESRA